MTGSRSPMDPLLSTCDREPIHIPGTIQPHGHLLVVDPLRGRILRASAGLEALGLASAAEAIGGPLDGILSTQDAERCRSAARRPEHPHLVDPFPVTTRSGRACDAAVHRVDQGVVVELWTPPADIDPHAEPDQAFAQGVQGVFGRLPFAIGHAARAQSLEDLCHRAAATIAELTGFDRVLVYQFTDTWDGEVVGEVKAEGVASYMGQRFPSTDIPVQARALYARNLVRLIPDVEYQPVPVVGARDSDPPVDMSFCNLRSVSPVHLEYLRNMEVAASFSVSLVVEGRLWGLIACHHTSPRALSLTVVGACQVFAETVAQQVLRLENRLRETHRARVAGLMDSLRQALAGVRRLPDALAETLDEIMDLFQVDSVVLAVDGRQRGPSGPLPGAPVMVEAGMATQTSDHPIPGVHLPPDLRSQFVGQILMPLSAQSDRDFLLLGRSEAERAIDWAGRPDKSPDLTPGGLLKINPRTSFALWREEVRGRSLPFSHLDEEAARILQLFLSERHADLRRQQVEDALHESRTRLRDLTECSSDWFWETDSRGRLVSVSDHLEGLGDLHPGDLVGRSLLSLLGEEAEAFDFGGLYDDGDPHRIDGGPSLPRTETQAIRQAFAQGRAFHGLTLSVEIAGRGQWWVRLSGVPRIGPDGVLLGFRGTGTDVTPFKRLQEERARVQRLESLGRMASGIAHEVNNVLQPVLTMSHVAARRLDDPAFLRAALDDIEEGCLRARDILRSVLTFARQTPARRRPVTIAPALTKAVTFAAKGLPGLDLHTDIEDTGARVLVNETELSQVVLNLLSNAADAMGGRGRVTVSLHHLVGSRRVTITVRDEGPGMDREIKARIFDPFFTTKPEGGGTGMGLAVVHGLIEAWGGSIGVESLPGDGTWFTISLPEIPARTADND